MDYIHHYSMHCYYFLIPWKNLLTIQQLHDVLLQMSSIHLTGSSLQANGKLWRHLKVENRPVALWWVCVIVSRTECHQKNLNRGESEVKSLFPKVFLTCVKNRRQNLYQNISNHVRKKKIKSGSLPELFCSFCFKRCSRAGKCLCWN